MGFIGDAFGANTNEVKNVVQAQNIAAPTNITPDQALLQQQQAFATALQNQMSGQGPSLAGNMLQNQAQQNAANAMGMAAAQRGVNPGLALRQGLQAGALGNQHAAQQAANARVQEQLGATGMYGNQVNALQQQNLGIQGANQQNAFNTAHANQQANLGASQLNTQIAQGNANTNAGIAGGILSGLAAAPMMGLYQGGKVPGYAGGGSVLPLSLAGPDSSGAQALQKGIGAASKLPMKVAKAVATGGMSTMADAALQMPEVGAQFAGQAPTLLPGASAVAGGPSLGIGQLGSGFQMPAQAPNAFGVASANQLRSGFKAGGKVPGKANVPGDSPKNDTVPIMASPGEIVIPRSHASDPEKAKAFVEQELKKRKGGGKSSSAHQRMMAAHKALGEAIAGMAEGGEVEEEPAAPTDLEAEPIPTPQPTGQESLASLSQMPSMPVPDRSSEPLEIEALPQVTAGMEQGATSQAVAAPQQKPMTLAEEARKYENQQAAAVMKGAQAGAEAQKNTADALAREAENLRSAEAKYQENLARLNQEHDALIDQYQSGKIDPHRVLGSTGAKIAAAIAIALGGLGQGLSKNGRNMGLEAINKAIDDDINAQKANLGKTANLLTLNMQRFHNLDQALAVTRMQKQAATQALIGQYAARSGSQQQIAAGQALAAQIHQAAMPQRQQMAYQQMLAGLSAQQGGELSGTQAQGLHKEDRERYVQGRGISGLTYDPKDAGPIRESIGTVDAAAQSIDKLLDISKTKGSQWRPNDVTAQAQTLTAMLKGAIRSEIVGPGAVSESEWKLLNDIVADPTKILQMDKNTQKRLETLKDTLDTGLRAKAKARGLSVPASIKEGAPRFGKR